MYVQDTPSLDRASLTGCVRCQNPYRLGNTTFYGNGSNFAVDTTQPFTVVTQWITADGTDTGELTEIRRKYVQNGKVIENPSISGN